MTNREKSFSPGDQVKVVATIVDRHGVVVSCGDIGIVTSTFRNRYGELLYDLSMTYNELLSLEPKHLRKVGRLRKPPEKFSPIMQMKKYCDLVSEGGGIAPLKEEGIRSDCYKVKTKEVLGDG